jgi:endoglucanase
MREASKDFLFELLRTPSPSGFEEKAANVWKEYVNPFCWKVESGVYGNTVAYTNGIGRQFGPKVVLFGHIDEIGLMVNYINDDGFIYVAMIGGVDRANLIGRAVTIHTSDGPISGVIARKAAHLLEEDECDTIPKLSKLPIDIGAISGEQAKELVSIGDPVTVDAEPQMLLNNRIVSRGLDDKVGAWVVAEVLREISYLQEQTFVVGVASVQEEIGLHGASMFASSPNPPGLAIAIDVMHASDIPDSDKETNGEIKLGDGPIISLGGPISKTMSRGLRDVAEANGIKYQLDIRPGYTGTDADGIFLKNGGIPTAVVSIPNRYMHSPVEMVQIEDLDGAVRLIKEWCVSSKF